MLFLLRWLLYGGRNRGHHESRYVKGGVKCGRDLYQIVLPAGDLTQLFNSDTEDEDCMYHTE